MQQGILSGLRVIDCGTYIAGPATATILSDFGAEVIKIERPPYGDPYRYLPQVPGMPVSDQNYCWILDGRNKKSVALDLSDAEAREALLKMVKTADVFITNYQPQLQRKFRRGLQSRRQGQQQHADDQADGCGDRNRGLSEAHTRSVELDLPVP